MKIVCEYSDHEGTDFDAAIIGEIVEKTIRLSRYAEVLCEKEMTVSIATVKTSEMRRVNNTYRNKDAVTDVISVGDYSDSLPIAEVIDESLFLGEVLVCWDFIQKSATIHNVDPVYEFGNVLSHGVLHLLGYAHGEEMFALQDRVSTELSPSLR